MKTLATTLVVLALVIAPGAFAFKGGGQGNNVVPTSAAPLHVPVELADLEGVVSWKTLADITSAKENDRIVPKFSGKLSALDKQQVKLQGFMLPLEVGEKQSHFFLTARPPSCGFCAPGGPDELVEVAAKAPIKYGVDPIVISGKFELVRNDPGGLLYRLTDATPAGN